jgi:hypothetical protein
MMHANALEIAAIPPRISDATVAQAYGIPEVTVRAIRKRNKPRATGKGKTVIGYTDAPPYDDRFMINNHTRAMREGSDKLLAAMLAVLAKRGKVKVEQ